MLEMELLNGVRSFSGGEAALAFWRFITALGDGGLVWIASALFLVCFSNTRRAGCALGTALFTGFVLCNATLKPLVERIRPCQMHPDALLYACPNDPSFPSGHTTASFAAALALAFFHPRWGAAALSLAVLIAWSRLYLFVHWPSDIAAGILIGALSAALAAGLVRKFFRPLALEAH